MNKKQITAVEQGCLRTGIVRDGALIRAGVMQEGWDEEYKPQIEVYTHRPRPLKDYFPNGKTPLPVVASTTFYSWFTRLYSPY